MFAICGPTLCFLLAVLVNLYVKRLSTARKVG